MQAPVFNCTKTALLVEEHDRMREFDRLAVDASGGREQSLGETIPPPCRKSTDNGDVITLLD